MITEKQIERVANIISSIVALLTTLLGVLGKKKVKKGRASDNLE